MRNNFNIVMEAIKNNNNSYILFYASPELKNNYSIVMEAVKINGYRLKFASNNLRKNREICLEAIKNNIDAFEFIDISLKTDINFLLDIYLLNKKIIPLTHHELSLMPSQDDLSLSIHPQEY